MFIENRNIVNDKHAMTKYEAVINGDSEYYVSQDVNQNGTKIFYNMSEKELLANLQKDNNLYEILHEDRPRNFHIDYDASWMQLKKHFENEGDGYDPTEKLVDSIKDAVNDFCSEFNLQEPVFNVLSACDKTKYSFHVNIPNIVLKNQEESKLFHDRFIKYCNDYPCPFIGYIDAGIYTKNRSMRMPNQNKKGKQRPLVILEGSQDIRDHLISYVDKKFIFKVPRAWKIKVKEAPKVELMSNDDFDENEMIHALLENTLHKTKAYKDWIEWIYACKGAGVPHYGIHDYSQQGCIDKYDYDVTQALIDGYNPEKTTMGLHTLKLWASENGYEVEKHFDVIAKPLPVLRKDHITWVDLRKKYHRKTYDDFYSMVSDLKDDVSQVIHKIDNKGFVLYQNEHDQFSFVKKPDPITLFYTTKNDNAGKQGKDKVTKIDLTTLMTEYPLHFPIYCNIVFKPNGKGLGRNELNTWGGFKAQPVEKVDMDYVQPILNHFREVWASDNEVVYKYIISWIAQIIKTPWRNTGVLMLLQGEQGDGKTLPCNFLMNKVFGRHLAFQTSGLMRLTERFNGHLANKVFINANELEMTGGDSFNGTFDKMKSLITDPVIQIEKKGFEGYTIDNHMNIIGTTNHMHTLRVEQGDRRYAIFETNSKYKGDFAYFKKLAELMDCDETGDHFYQYMLNYPEENMVDLSVIPDTQMKRDMIEMSKVNPVRFVESISEHVDKAALYDLRDGTEISKNNMFIQYMAWAEFSRERVYSVAQFWKMIKGLVTEKKLKIDGKTVRAAVFKNDPYEEEEEEDCVQFKTIPV